jgi:hypothetical protein
LGVENLDAVRTAQVLEMYVALLGIVLLTPIFYPEQNRDIKDLVESKFTSVTGVYLLRILESGIFLALLTGGYILLLKYNNCTFVMMEYYLGTLAEALFLGGMGVFAYSLFDQIAIAYMLPMIYYVMAFGGGSKYQKNFYLFSMMTGSYKEKVYLAVGGMLLILFGLLYRYLVKKLR